jgi:sterol desaturase/sphingolipid hydroxylase (fatty acid hydroxylase superfamily)
MLPCMDWIFGTYYLPRKQWPSAYGIEANLPKSLAGQLAYPFPSDAPEARLPDPIAADR